MSSTDSPLRAAPDPIELARRAAFRAVVGRCGPDIALDISQAAASVLLENPLYRGKPANELIGLAIGIARHLLHSHWAQQRIHSRARDSIPDRNLSRSEAVDRDVDPLVRALGKLDADSVELLRLRYAYGQTYKVIAMVMGLASPGAARVACFRARQRLSEILGEG